MKEPNGIGNIINASFSEKIGLVGGALTWYGWYLIGRAIWDWFGSFERNRIADAFEKECKLKENNPDDWGVIDDDLPIF